jgi:hypothetical protein
MSFARSAGGASDPRAARNGDIVMVKGLSFFLSAVVGREKASTGFLTAIRQQMPLVPRSLATSEPVASQKTLRAGTP